MDPKAIRIVPERVQLPNGWLDLHLVLIKSMEGWGQMLHL